MKFLKTIFDTSYELSANHPERPSVFVYCKLVEETCELSDVFYSIESSEPLNGEIADVIISALDLLYVCEYQHLQHLVSMTREEIFDTMKFNLRKAAGMGEDDGDLLEDFWFVDTINEFPYHLSMITHYKGRITRLLNQPGRTDDNMNDLIQKLLAHTGRAACAYSRKEMLSFAHETRIKAEHAIEHKVTKWRGKFGL